MPPKRQKAKSMPVGAETLSSVWLAAKDRSTGGTLQFGRFLTNSNSIDTAKLLWWAPALSAVLDYCTNGVLAWDECRVSLRKQFQEKPRMDPHLKSEIDTSTSAEMCAAAFKKMLGEAKCSVSDPCP